MFPFLMFMAATFFLCLWSPRTCENYECFQFIFLFYFLFLISDIPYSYSYPGPSVEWGENWTFLAWLTKKQSMCSRWFSEISAFVRKKRKGWGKDKNRIKNIGVFWLLQTGFGGNPRTQHFCGVLCINNHSCHRGKKYSNSSTWIQLPSSN